MQVWFGTQSTSLKIISRLWLSILVFFWGGGGMGYWPYYKPYYHAVVVHLQDYHCKHKYGHNKVASLSFTQVKLWTQMKALSKLIPSGISVYLIGYNLSETELPIVSSLSLSYTVNSVFSWSLNHTHSLLALPSKLLRNVNTCKDKERTNMFNKQRSRGRGLNVQTRQYNSTIQALPEHEVLFFNIAE